MERARPGRRFKSSPAYGQRRENEARRRGGVERRRNGPNRKQYKTSKLTRRAAIAQQPLLQPKLAPAVGQVRNLHLFLHVRDQVGSWVRHGDVRVDGLSWLVVVEAKDAVAALGGQQAVLAGLVGVGVGGGERKGQRGVGMDGCGFSEGVCLKQCAWVSGAPRHRAPDDVGGVKRVPSQSMATMMNAALAGTAEWSTTDALSEAITTRRGDFATSSNTLLEQVSRDIFRQHPRQATFNTEGQPVLPPPPQQYL